MRCLIGLMMVICLAAGVFGGGVWAEEAKEEAGALVDRLVSQNPRPITMEEDKKVGSGYKTPEGYDKAKQRIVLDARRKLVELGPAAFPYLIERWDDKRYCLTTENALSGACHNSTVGKECRTIIFDQLQPFGYWQHTDSPRGKALRPSYVDAFLPTREAAKQWWEKHKGKSLQAMQLMVVDWIIEEEAKRPEAFTDSERAYLKKFREELKESGKPVEWGNYYSAEREFQVEPSEGTGETGEKKREKKD